MNATFTAMLSVPATELRKKASGLIVAHLGHDYRPPFDPPKNSPRDFKNMMELIVDGQVIDTAAAALSVANELINGFRQSLMEVSDIASFWEACTHHSDLQEELPESVVPMLAAMVWQEGRACSASLTPETECRLKTFPLRISPAHRQKALQTRQAALRKRSPATSEALS